MGAEADEVELKARQNSNGNQAGGMPQVVGGEAICM